LSSVIFQSVKFRHFHRAGFKGERANWTVAQRPPQLRGLHKTVKNYYLLLLSSGNIKILFETDNLE